MDLQQTPAIRKGLQLFLSLILTLLFSSVLFIPGMAKPPMRPLFVPANPVVSPLTNSHTAPLTTSISITYNEPISPGTVSSQTFVVHARYHGRLTETYTINGGAIVFNPVQPLFSGELVYVSATTNTLGLDGSHPNNPTVWQFRAKATGGSANFSPGTPTSFGGNDSYDLDLGDLDGDGDLDVVIANDNNQAETVWLNDGNGFFSAHPYTPTFGTNDTWGITLGDIDGDGDLDAMTAHSNADVHSSVWLNDGLGGFYLHPTSSAIGNGDTRHIALGDLDGDGDLDAVAAIRDASETVWLNDSTGFFSPHSYSATILTTSDRASDVDLGDLDNDGDLDLLVANDNNFPEAVWLNDGLGGFSPHPITPTFGGLDTLGVVLGDLNDDGFLDVVVANTNNGYDSVWLNDGTGGFSPHPTTPQLGNRSNTDVAIGDLNGDGNLDVVFADGGTSSQTSWVNDGLGNLSLANTPNFGGRRTFGISFGDLDGDNDLDLILANQLNQAESVWLNTDRVDLALSKFVAPNEVFPGQTVTYTLVYTNLGPQIPSNVVIDDLVPNQLTNVQITYSGPEISATNNVSYEWQVIDTLFPGTSGLIKISGQISVPLAPMVFTNTAGITNTIYDSDATNNRQAVTITVLNAPPLLGDDSANTLEEIPVTLDILANDSDLNGDDLILEAIGLPLSGTATISAETVIYTPTLNFFGVDTFTYRVNDNQGAVSTATITINVGDINDPPLALDDMPAPIPEDSQNVSLDILANDSDVENNPLTIIQISTPNQGGTILNGGNVVTYTPVANFFGSEVFTYNISDGSLIATATVTMTVVNVNDDPLANDDFYGVWEDSQDNSFELLINDTYLPDPVEVLTITTVGQPTQGGLVINGGQVISYTPAPDFAGTDVFTYLIEDGHGGYDSGLVTMVVTNINDLPLVNNDVFTTVEDSPATPLVVLSNDSDIDNDTLSISQIGATDNGGSTLTDGTVITYTPAADFFGMETFSYTVSDGNGGYSSGWITITIENINDNPVANVDTPTVQEDSQNNTLEVVLNDSFAPDEDEVLYITNVSSPNQGGSATFSGYQGSTFLPAGTVITYTPAFDFYGEEVFTYTLEDGNGGQSIGLVTVTVENTNDNPTATDDLFSVEQNTTNNILPVLDNDDYAPDPLEALTISNVTTPDKGGSVSINATNSALLYSPSTGFLGTEAFSYTIADGNGGSATATVSILVNNVNDPPQAGDDNFDVAEDSQNNLFIVTNNDFDPDIGDSFTVTLVGTPDNGGRVTISGITAVRYTPLPNFNGLEVFTYTIADDEGLQDTATINVTVNPVNDPPRFTSTPVITVIAGMTYTYAISTTDVDSTDNLSLTAVTSATWLSLVDNGDGTGELSGTPTTTDVGLNQVTLEVNDGQVTVNQTFTIEVLEVVIDNNPPEFTSIPNTVAKLSSSYLYNITTSDLDENDSLTIQALTAPAWLSLVDNGNGSATLAGSPAQINLGQNPVVLAVSDGLITTTQAFTVTVFPNQLYLPTILKGWPAPADLIITDLVYNNQTGAAVITIKNEGNQSTGSTFYVDLYIDEEPTERTDLGLYFSETSELGPNASIEVNIPDIVLSAGSHQLYAQVDTYSGTEGTPQNGQVNETNEDNNIYGPVDITVSKPARYQNIRLAK